MPRHRMQQARSRRRREQIVQAALACFSEVGFSDTTVEDIRDRSKASNGSIYHHFESKEDLAAAVYLEGLRVFQRGFVQTLEENADAREGLLAVVRYHLTWVAENSDWSRYLFQKRRAEFMTAREADIKQENKVFLGRLSEWIAPHVEQGRMRKLPLELYTALIFGPCQEFARHWLEGRMRTEVGRAATELGEAIWRALAA